MKKVFLLLTLCSCSQRLLVRSFPNGAEVKVSDTSGTNSKVVGNTPIRLKVDKGLGSLFFIELSKEKYRSKRILVNTDENANLRVDTKLEVMAEYEERLKNAVSNVAKQQKKVKEFYNKESGIFELVKNSKETIDSIETQISLYKAMLFNQKYSRGIAAYDKERIEQLVELVDLSKKHESELQYNDAIKVMKQALNIDENNVYLYKYLSELYKKNKNEAAYIETLKIIERLNPSNKYSSNL